MPSTSPAPSEAVYLSVEREAERDEGCDPGKVDERLVPVSDRHRGPDLKQGNGGRVARIRVPEEQGVAEPLPLQRIGERHHAAILVPYAGLVGPMRHGVVRQQQIPHDQNAIATTLIAHSVKNSQNSLRVTGGMPARLAAERRHSAGGDGSGFATNHPAQARAIKAPAIHARFQR